ncbi:MAG: hypothetical protein HY582_03205 [Candidatus Omnitrophica bacterium]|nr:hypothetical protein [Candidatus Omnitrophota bacterium]
MNRKMLIVFFGALLLGFAMALLVMWGIRSTSVKKSQTVDKPVSEIERVEIPPAETVGEADQVKKSEEEKEKNEGKEKVVAKDEESSDKEDVEEAASEDAESDLRAKESVKTEEEEVSEQKRANLEFELVQLGQNSPVDFRKYDDRLTFALQLKVRNAGNETTGGGAISSSLQVKLFGREHRFNFSDRISYIHPGHAYLTWIRATINPTPVQMQRILGRDVSIPMVLHAHVRYTTLSMAAITEEQEAKTSFEVSAIG